MKDCKGSTYFNTNTLLGNNNSAFPDLKKNKLTSAVRNIGFSFSPYLIIVGLFTLLRGIYFLVNKDFFTSTGYGGALSAFTFGARLDLIVAFYLVTPFLFLSRIKKFRNLLLTPLLLILFGFIVLSTIDMLYFTFLKEHISFDFFQLLDTSNNISLWTYVKDYWLFAVIILLIQYFLSKGLLFSFKHSGNIQWGYIMATVVVCFFLARGGFRSKPIRTVDVSQHVATPYSVLAVNTPLFMFESWANPMDQPEIPNDIKPNLRPQSYRRDSFKPYNVVILILESFGEEYTGENHGFAENYTPYLNQLGRESVLCASAFANGLKSVDAVPAIFSGIPHLSTSAFIHSPRSSKVYPSLFNLLKTRGYTSLFFHGADNNSMGFQSYLVNQGLDRYYGIDEYPDREQDFDGNWGIFDQPYLQYACKQLNSTPEPFVAGVFTLTSHHPYPIPASMKDSFPKGDLAIHKSIGYTDYSLKCFMDSCRKEEWFDHTIFVITADHSAENQLHAYRTPAGKYEIPLFFYAPGILAPQRISKTVSQLDILPTILDLTGFPEDVTTIGNSVFSKKSNGVAHFDNQTFYLVKDSMSMGYSNGKCRFLYNRRADINCLSDLSETNPGLVSQMESNLFQHLSNYEFLIGQTGRYK